MIKKNLSLVSISILSLLFVLIPQVQILNLKINVFDTGVFLSSIFNIINNNNYSVIYDGHLQLCLLPISFLIKFYPTNADHLLLLIHSFSIILPSIYLFKINPQYSLAYIIFFPIWFINMNGFHTDAFVLFPLTIFFFSKNLNIKVFAAISFIFIKEIYIILSLSCFVYLGIQYRNNYYYLISLFFFIIFLYITLYFLPNNSQSVTYLKNANSIDNLKLSSIVILLFEYFKQIQLSKIIFFPLIFLPVFFSVLKIKEFYLFYLPFFLIYLIVPNENLFKPQFHYSLLFIPVILYFFVINKSFRIQYRKYIIINFSIILVGLFNIFNLYQFRNYNLLNLGHLDKKIKLNKFVKKLNIRNDEFISTNNNLNINFVYTKNIINIIDLHEKNIFYTKVLCSRLTNKQRERLLSKKIINSNQKICTLPSENFLLTKDYYSKIKKKDIINIEKNFYISKENKNYIYLKKND